MEKHSMEPEYRDLLGRLDKLQTELDGVRHDLLGKLLKKTSPTEKAQEKPATQPPESVEKRKPDIRDLAALADKKTATAPVATSRTSAKAGGRIPTPTAVAAKKDKPRQDNFLELLVGRQVISIVGILLLIAGMAYGAAYAYRHLHFPPAMRMLTAGVLSLGLLLAGVFLCRRKQYRFFALVLQGGGIAGLYITCFASYQLHHLLSAYTAGICLMIVALSAMLLSALFNSQVIGVIGVAGAFAMPLLIRLNNLNHTFFLGYLLCINIPAVVLGFKKKWQSLYNLSFYLTLLIGWWWMDSYYSQQHFSLALTFWALFNIEYLLLALVTLMKHKTVQRGLGELIRLVVNTVMLIPVFCEMFSRHDIWQAYAVAALVYFVFAFAASRFYPKMTGEILLYFGGGVLFVTLAIPAYFEGSMVAVMWNIEALCLAIFAARAKSPSIARAASLIALLGFICAVFFNLDCDVFENSLFLSWQFAAALICLILILAQACVNIVGRPDSDSGKLLMAIFGFGLIVEFAINCVLFFTVIEYSMLLTAAVAMVLAFAWGFAARKRFSFLSKYSQAVAVVPFLGSLLCLSLDMASEGGIPLRCCNAPGSIWYYVLWGVAGLLLYWGAARRTDLLPAAALVAFTGIVKVFIFRESFVAQPIFWNESFFAGLVAIALFLLLYWRPWWREDAGQSEELPPQGIRDWFFPAAMVLISVIFVQNFWFFYGGFTDGFRLFTTVTVALSGIALCVVAFLSRRQLWYKAGICFFCLALFLIILDVINGNVLDGPIFTSRFLWVRMVIIGLTLPGCLMGRRFSLSSKENALIALIGISALLLLCVVEFSHLEKTWANMSIIIFLSAAAVVICFAGLWKRISALRIYSFFVLGIAIYWLINRNLWGLKDPARIFAFLGVGVLLLALSFVYHKVSAILLEKQPDKRIP